MPRDFDYSFNLGKIRSGQYQYMALRSAPGSSMQFYLILLKDKKSLLAWLKRLELEFTDSNELMKNVFIVEIKDVKFNVGINLMNVDGEKVCKNQGAEICNLGYCCDGCPYAKSGPYARSVLLNMRYKQKLF